ncbi:MAG: hypothetical protein ACREC1_05805 [Methylovirgula sp.]
MFRLTLRLLGLLLLAAAFAALVVDGTRSIAGGALSLAPFGKTMLWLLPSKFASVREAAQHALPLFLWDSVMVRVLHMPTCVVAGGLGVLLMLVTQKRQPKIGYSNR